MDNPKPRKFVLKVPLDYRRQEAVHEPSHKADSVDTADQDIQDLLDDDDHEDDAGVSHPSSPIAVESTASVLKSQPPSPLATPRGSSVARDPDDLGTPKRPSKRPKYNKKSLKPSDSTTPAGEEGTATPSGRVSGTTTPTNGAGTWRKGLKKGQTRADAIAQFKKRNPGQPLPAGWEPAPSGGSSERPSLAVTSGLVKSSTGSFRDPDGTGSGSAAVDKVKGGHLVGHVTIVAPSQHVDDLDDQPTPTVKAAFPTYAYPYQDARSIQLDIHHATPHELAKLNLHTDLNLTDLKVLENGDEPAQVPKNHSPGQDDGDDQQPRKNVVYKHYIETTGIPVIKAVDPAKVSPQTRPFPFCQKIRPSRF